jgi:hypothetical protein
MAQNGLGAVYLKFISVLSKVYLWFITCLHRIGCLLAKTGNHRSGTLYGVRLAEIPENRIGPVVPNLNHGQRPSAARKSSALPATSPGTEPPAQTRRPI